MLALAAQILRKHLDRHLEGSMVDPAEVTRWPAAVNGMLREGLIRPAD